MMALFTTSERALARVAKLADAQDLGSCGFYRAGSSPALRNPCGKQHAGVAQLVELLPSKQKVAGSSPVSRSVFIPFFQFTQGVV